MDGNNRLDERQFDSLDAMMAAYADEAVRVAQLEYGVLLDFGQASVPALEGIFIAMEDKGGSKPDVQQAASEYATKLWGGYFGEVLRRHYNGAWEMSVYPGGSLAVPALEVNGSRLYPLMKVHRRLTLGRAEDVFAFYTMVVGRLGVPVFEN